jgi:hypothetical protein
LQVEFKAPPISQGFGFFKIFDCEHEKEEKNQELNIP